MAPSTIHITVTKQGDKDEQFTVVLPRVAPHGLMEYDEDPGRNYEVAIDSAALNGRSVFRCQLTRQSDSDPQTVILKISTTELKAPHQARNMTALDRREEEAERYIRELKLLQGKAVPQFLGFYKGEHTIYDTQEKIFVACILLEDCGKNISSADWETERFKVWIGNVLARFHIHSHFNHNSLTRNHIVYEGQRLVLINFNNVTAHDCEFSRDVSGVKFRDIISQQLPDPGLELIGCIEIYDYCQKMKLFIPSTYEYNRSTVKIDSHMKSAEDLACVVREFYSEPMYEKSLEVWSRRTWKEIEPNLDKYSLVPWTSARFRTSGDKDEGAPSGGKDNAEG